MDKKDVVMARARRACRATVSGNGAAMAAMVTAMVAGLYLAPARAQSSVAIYGVADAGIEWSSSGRGGKFREVSGGSLGNRLGFRGTEDLGGGMSAVFRLEQGFNIDDGNSGQGGRLFGREASVGVASRSYGTLLLGRNPLPYFSVLNALDAFGWMGSGGALAISRSGTSTQQLLPAAVTGRADNSVLYVSPSLGGIELRAMGSFKENSTTTGGMYSASARYRQGAVDLVAGYSRIDSGSGGSGHATSYALGGSYDFGMLRAYLGLTEEKNSCRACGGALAMPAGGIGYDLGRFRLINLGVRSDLGKWSVFAQVTRINDRSRYVAAVDRDATWFAVGASYALSKRTSLYGTAATVGNKNGSQYVLGSGTAQQPAGSAGSGDPRAYTAVVGIRHSF